MENLKFPMVPTLVLFALTGLLAFYMPLPNLQTQSSVASKVFR